MKKWLTSAALAASIAAVASPAIAAPSGPPGPVLPLQDFIKTACLASDGFLIDGTVTGKTKDIEHQGGFITINPGVKTTLTANGKTLSIVATGTFHVETSIVDGVTVFTVKATGRNLLTRPADSDNPGLFLTTGNVTFIVDEFGNEIQGFEGSGRVTDICAALS
jgi:hypothetical protein